MNLNAPGQYMSLEETQDILYSRMVNLTGELKNSVNFWNIRCADALSDPSTRATVINEKWYRGVCNTLMSVDRGVRHGIQNRQQYFVIDEKLILRFKHLDENLDSKNYPTLQSEAWRLQFPLDGIPRCERVELGYRLDITGTVIKDAFVILGEGKLKYWIWQVWGDRVDTFQLPLIGNRTAQGIDKFFAHTNYSSVT